MYCSYCKSTGHEIRNYKVMNAPISCPALLKMTCTYCGKNGHKINKCSLMLKHNQNYNCKKVSVNKEEYKEKMIVNRFDLLEMDDEDDTQWVMFEFGSIFWFTFLGLSVLLSLA